MTTPYQFGTWYRIETAPKDGTPILVIEGVAQMVAEFLPGQGARSFPLLRF
jgi:hypothetical protein